MADVAITLGSHGVKDEYIVRELDVWAAFDGVYGNAVWLGETDPVVEFQLNLEYATHKRKGATVNRMVITSMITGRFTLKEVSNPNLLGFAIGVYTYNTDVAGVKRLWLGTDMAVPNESLYIFKGVNQGGQNLEFVVYKGQILNPGNFAPNGTDYAGVELEFESNRDESAPAEDKNLGYIDIWDAV